MHNDTNGDIVPVNFSFVTEFGEPKRESVSILYVPVYLLTTVAVLLLYTVSMNDVLVVRM